MSCMETWHVKEDSLTGGEGGACSGARKCGTWQTRTHLLERRKREERVGELGNVACCKQGPFLGEGGGGMGWGAEQRDRVQNREGLAAGGGEGGGSGGGARREEV